MRIYIFPTWLRNISKIHDLVTIYFHKDDRFTYEKETNFPAIKQKIDENLGNPEVGIIIYMSLPIFPYVEKTLDYINSFDRSKVKLKLILFTEDFWYHLDQFCVGGKWAFKEITVKMFRPKNHYTLTFAKSLEQLESFHGEKLTEFKNNFRFINLWSCYQKSFVKFNENPINKILVMGAVGNLFYPERTSLIVSKNEKIKYRQKVPSPDLNFSSDLNKYLCCFASSVHVFNKSEGKIKNTGILLQKYFEIIASGALLLCPNTEKDELNKIGLYSMENCIMVEMKDINSWIDYITNPQNRNEIDRIRKKGQLLAKGELNSEKKFNEVVKILESLF